MPSLANQTYFLDVFILVIVVVVVVVSTKAEHAGTTAVDRLFLIVFFVCFGLLLSAVLCLIILSLRLIVILFLLFARFVLIVVLVVFVLLDIVLLVKVVLLSIVNFGALLRRVSTVLTLSYMHTCYTK